mmetsp:Transcript_10640/g.43036  ORF Transcript_10640/g.43036 Transcript_10640/m.43036 type:complete len:143 (+) Transcript_10640:50-478(+)
MLRQVVFASLAVASWAACSLPDGAAVVVADMHDGDQKLVTLDGTALTITPHANDEEWTIAATLDADSCTAVVDFDVPGKPSPPPVPLTATVWALSTTASDGLVAIGFTDPSATIADTGDYPVNYWIEIATEARPAPATAVEA